MQVSSFGNFRKLQSETQREKKSCDVVEVQRGGTGGRVPPYRGTTYYTNVIAQISLRKSKKRKTRKRTIFYVVFCKVLCA